MQKLSSASRYLWNLIWVSSWQNNFLNFNVYINFKPTVLNYPMIITHFFPAIFLMVSTKEKENLGEK